MIILFVYLLYIYAQRTSKGRTPSRYVTEVPRVTVEAWAASQPEEAWQRIATRDSSKGKLMMDILTCRVWVWNGDKPAARQWHLVVRREVSALDTIKYSLSNAPEEISVEPRAYKGTSQMNACD